MQPWDGNMLTNLIVWIVLGALAGWLASLIICRDGANGAGANIVVGIVGGLLGGLLFNAFGASGVSGLNLYSLLVAVVGSVVLIWLVGALRRA
jgi:uncharacterized membrane protein YeaQ/YmgE (transglycosylase-associated protein family)